MSYITSIRIFACLLCLLSSPAFSMPVISIQAEKLFRGIKQPVVVAVTNSDNKPLDTVLEWALPAGWEISPTQAPVHAEAGETVNCRHHIQPTEYPLGESIRIKIKAASVQTEREIALEEPFSLTFTDSVTSWRSDSRTIRLLLKNRTDQILSGTLEVYPPEGWTVPGGTKSEIRDIQPKEEIKTSIQYRKEKNYPSKHKVMMLVFRCQKSKVITYRQLETHVQQ